MQGLEFSPSEIPDLETLVDRLKADLPGILAGMPVRLVYQYGSAVRGEMLPHSDVDIAPVYGPDSGLSSYDQMLLDFKIADAIGTRCGIRKADVRSIDDAPLAWKGKVLTQGRLVYSRDEAFRVDFEVLTRNRYFDFLPVIRQMQDALVKRVRERGLIRYGP
jgi:hypothetical protein